MTPIAPFMPLSAGSRGTAPSETRTTVKIAMAPKKAEKTKADKAEKAAKAVKTNVAKKAGATGFHQWVLSWNRSWIMLLVIASIVLGHLHVVMGLLPVLHGGTCDLLRRFMVSLQAVHGRINPPNLRW